MDDSKKKELLIFFQLILYTFPQHFLKFHFLEAIFSNFHAS